MELFEEFGFDGTRCNDEDLIDWSDITEEPLFDYNDDEEFEEEDEEESLEQDMELTRKGRDLINEILT